MIRPATARNSSAAKERRVLERAAVGDGCVWSKKYPARLSAPPFELRCVWQSRQCGVYGQSNCGESENSNYHTSAAHDCLLCAADQPGKGPIARRRMLAELNQNECEQIHLANVIFLERGER